MNYDNAIARCMHVELDAFGAELERPGEGRERVFGQRIVRAAVGYPERWPAW
jgi:hypothetical protein